MFVVCVWGYVDTACVNTVRTRDIFGPVVMRIYVHAHTDIHGHARARARAHTHTHTPDSFGPVIIIRSLDTEKTVHKVLSLCFLF